MTMQDLPDKALIDACLAGRPEVYEILVRRHQHKLSKLLGIGSLDMNFIGN